MNNDVDNSDITTEQNEESTAVAEVKYPPYLKATALAMNGFTRRGLKVGKDIYQLEDFEGYFFQCGDGVFTLFNPRRIKQLKPVIGSSTEHVTYAIYYVTGRVFGKKVETVVFTPDDFFEILTRAIDPAEPDIIHVAKEMGDFSHPGSKIKVTKLAEDIVTGVLIAV